MKTREQVYEEVNKHVKAAYNALLTEDGELYYEDIQFYCLWDSGRDSVGSAAAVSPYSLGRMLFAEEEHLDIICNAANAAKAALGERCGRAK